MLSITEAFTAAWQLMTDGQSPLWRIVLLSVQVSGLAVVIAAAIALPVAGLLAVSQFKGRAVVVAILNALMGFPPVVLGLLIYLLLSRAGPLGALGILFTPSAMVIAQVVLIAPIIAALALQTMGDEYHRLRELLQSLNASRWQTIKTLIWECRISLCTAVLAGLGRAFAEVGAVMMVGGNINGVTRVMTTAIALETSKGEMALAIGLGIILLGLVLLINLVAQGLRGRYVVLRT